MTPRERECSSREIHSLDPQPHRHSMLVPRIYVHLGLRGVAWGSIGHVIFFRKRLAGCWLESRHAQLVSWQFQSDPGPVKPGQIRLPRRWAQQAANPGVNRLSMTHIVGGSEI